MDGETGGLVVRVDDDATIFTASPPTTPTITVSLAQQTSDPPSTTIDVLVTVTTATELSTSSVNPYHGMPTLSPLSFMSTILTTSVPTSTIKKTVSPTSNGAGVPRSLAAIVGSVVGGATLVALAGLLLFCHRRRRRRHRMHVLVSTEGLGYIFLLRVCGSNRSLCLNRHPPIHGHCEATRVHFASRRCITWSSPQFQRRFRCRPILVYACGTWQL